MILIRFPQVNMLWTEYLCDSHYKYLKGFNAIFVLQDFQLFDFDPPNFNCLILNLQICLILHLIILIDL